MTLKIDSNKCANISNCHWDELCIKICEQQALMDDNGILKIINEK